MEIRPFRDRRVASTLQYLRIARLSKSRTISAISPRSSSPGLIVRVSSLCARVSGLFSDREQRVRKGTEKRRVRELKGAIVRRISTKNASGLISLRRAVLLPLQKIIISPAFCVPRLATVYERGNSFQRHTRWDQRLWHSSGLCQSSDLLTHVDSRRSRRISWHAVREAR